MKDFRFDTKTLNWGTYIENYYLGIKKFLIKEDLSKIEKSRKRLKRYYLYNLNKQ